MKRKLALIVSVLMIIAMVFTVASCGGADNDDSNDSNVHTYSKDWKTSEEAHWQESTCAGHDHEVLQANYAPHSFGDDGKCSVCDYCNHLLDTEWTSDASSHWHAPNCDEHKDEKPSFEPHSFGNDGKCTVCGYCTHLIDSKWSSDENSHWHEATCDAHKGTKFDVASHTFEGAKCTVCGYCKHSYKTEWSTDATNHWHDADCGCADVSAKDVGAHVDDVVDGKCDVCGAVVCKDHVDGNSDGACDVCGFITDKALNTISKLDVEAVAKMNSFVVDYYKKTVSGGYEALTDIVASVKYYDNYAVYHTVDGETFYCSAYGDEGTLFVIRVVTYGEGEYAETEIIRDTNVTEYPTGTTVVYIDIDYSVTATSNEELIADLYNLKNKVGQVLAYDEETGMVSFSFAYVNTYEDDYSGSVSNVFVISVEFALDEETNGVKNANVKIDKYETADVTIDTEANTYTVAEGAEKLQEVVYGITQTFGEAFDSTNEPNPYPAEGNVITEDFTLVTKDDEGNVTDEFSSDDDVLTIIVGEGATLYFDDATAAALGYSTIEITTSDYLLDASYYDKEIFVNAYVDGEYLLTVIVEGIEVTITVKVEYKPTTEFEADAETIETYVGTDAIVGAIVGENQNPYTTATVVEGDASKITFAKDGDKWAVSATEEGTYVIELVSVSNPELKDRVTIIFAEAPSLVDLLTGTYVGRTSNWLNVTAVFTAADETTGTVSLLITGTIHIHGGDEGNTTIEVNVSGTYAYEYNAQTGLFALTLTEGNGVEEYFEYLALENYEVVAQLKNELSPCTLEKETAGGEDGPVIGGEATTSPITIYITDNNCYVDQFIFVAGETGTYTFTVPAGVGITTVERDEQWKAPFVDHQVDRDGGVFTMDLKAGEVVEFLIGATNKNITVEIPFTFEANAGGGDEPTVEPGLAGTYTADNGFGGFEVVITDTTISFTPPRSPMIEWTYTYEDGVLTVYSAGTAITNPMMGGAEVDADKNIFSKLYYNGYTYTLTKQASAGGDEGGDDENDGIAGTYTATDSYNNSITVVVTADTITFTPPMSNEVVWTYVYENGTVSIFSDGTPITMPMAGYFEVSNGVPSMMIYNGTQYTISVGGSSEGGDTTEVDITGTYTGTSMFGTTIDVVIGADTIEITMVHPMTGMPMTDYYEYTIVDGAVVVTQAGEAVDPMQVEVVLENDAAVGITYNGTGYTLAVGGGEEEEETGIAGTYTGTSMFGTTIDVVIGADTIEITMVHPMTGMPMTDYYEYTIVDGAVVVTQAGEAVDPMQVEVVLENGAAAGITYNGTGYTLAAGGSSEEPEEPENPGEQTGTEGNPTAWDEIPTEVTINSDTNNKIYYTFTATQSGTLTITYPTADSWADLYAWENDQWNGQNSQSSSMQEVAAFTIESGKTYRIGIGTFNNAGEFTLPISFTEGEAGGGDEPEEPAGNVLVIGENTVTITEADAEQGGLMFTFTTFYAGQYTFASNDVGARVFDGETVLGMGVVQLEANKTYNVFVLAAEAGTYDLEIVFTEVGGDEPTEGTEENPIIWEEIPSEVTITSNTMDYTYFKFTATESGALVITYTNNESYAKLCELVNDEIDYEKIQNSLKKNRAQFVVEEGKTYLLGLATYNTEGEFTLPVEMGEIIPDGSQDYPFAGEFDTDYVANFQGGYTGLYYTFVAPNNGYVTVTSTYEGTPWLQIGTDIDDLTNNVVGMDPETYENIYANTVKMYVFAGQTVYVAVGDGTFEAGEVPFKVTFEAFESESSEKVAGTWTGEVDNWGSITTYTVVINADGTGSIDENYGWSSSEYTITFILVDGSNVTVTAEDEYGNISRYVFVYDADADTLTGTGDINAVFTKA